MSAGASIPRRQALRITAVVGLGGALGGGLVSAVLRRAGLHRVSETRTRMGTVVTITVVHPEGPDAKAMVTDAFAEVDRLEGLLSRHRPETPLSRLNASGRLEGAPAELTRVVERALHWSRLTSGAFDPTVKPLLDLYDAWFARRAGPPSSAAVRSALAVVDHRGVHVEGAAIALAQPGMALTLDGIAKGYVVDRTVDVLVAHGADRVMVDAGGDMSSAGRGSIDEPWTVAVQHPRDERAAIELVQLGGDCIATSGDYMRAFTDDLRFHHIVDPRTGYSPLDASSATVLAATAMDADALSTAALVLGPEAGIELLEGLSEVEGLIVGKDGRRARTSGMRRHTGAS